MLSRGFCTVLLIAAVFTVDLDAASIRLELMPELMPQPLARAAPRPEPEPYDPYVFQRDSIIRSLEVVFNWASRDCLLEGAIECEKFVKNGKDEGFTPCAMDFFRQKNGHC